MMRWRSFSPADLLTILLILPPDGVRAYGRESRPALVQVAAASENPMVPTSTLYMYTLQRFVSSLLARPRSGIARLLVVSTIGKDCGTTAVGDNA